MRIGVLTLIVSMAAIGPASADEFKLNISNVLWAVRQQLIEAQERGREQGIEPLFYTKTLELELHFVVKRSANAATGFELWVVDVDGGVNYTDEQLQKIKLTFETLASLDHFPESAEMLLPGSAPSESEGGEVGGGGGGGGGEYFFY